MTSLMVNDDFLKICCVRFFFGFGPVSPLSSGSAGWRGVPKRNVWPRKKLKKKGKKPLELPLPLPLPHRPIQSPVFGLISCGCCKPSVCRFVIGRVYQTRDSFLLDKPRWPTRSLFIRFLKHMKLINTA